MDNSILVILLVLAVLVLGVFLVKISKQAEKKKDAAVAEAIAKNTSELNKSFEEKEQKAKDIKIGEVNRLTKERDEARQQIATIKEDTKAEVENEFKQKLEDAEAKQKIAETKYETLSAGVNKERLIHLDATLKYDPAMNSLKAMLSKLDDYREKGGTTKEYQNSVLAGMERNIKDISNSRHDRYKQLQEQISNDYALVELHEEKEDGGMIGLIYKKTMKATKAEIIGILEEKGLELTQDGDAKPPFKEFTDFFTLVEETGVPVLSILDLIQRVSAQQKLLYPSGKLEAGTGVKDQQQGGGNDKIAQAS